jgi:hypothetical protein
MGWLRCREALMRSCGHDRLDIATGQADVLELVVVERRQDLYIAPLAQHLRPALRVALPDLYEWKVGCHVRLLVYR